jgi:excisionase family DNA binding protein
MKLSDTSKLLVTNKLLFSKDEAADILGVSRHTIIRDCRLGHIATLHYGRRVLIPRSEILRIASQGMLAEATSA